MLNSLLCGLLILFFAWLLLHALIYSKSTTLIEGLENSPSPSPSPSPSASSAPSLQAQVDMNTAEIAIMKGQVANIMKTAQDLQAQMIKNEATIQNTTNNIQKVVQSQDDMHSKLANMKSSQ